MATCSRYHFPRIRRHCDGCCCHIAAERMQSRGEPVRLAGDFSIAPPGREASGYPRPHRLPTALHALFHRQHNRPAFVPGTVSGTAPMQNSAVVRRAVVAPKFGRLSAPCRGDRCHLTSSPKHPAAQWGQPRSAVGRLWSGLSPLPASADRAHDHPKQPWAPSMRGFRPPIDSRKAGGNLGGSWRGLSSTQMSFTHVSDSSLPIWRDRRTGSPPSTTSTARPRNGSGEARRSQLRAFR